MSKSFTQRLLLAQRLFLDHVGAEVEVLELPAEHAPRIAAAEAMGPIPLFHAYAATVELPAEAVAAGQQILEVIGPLQSPTRLGFPAQGNHHLASTISL